MTVAGKVCLNDFKLTWTVEFKWKQKDVCFHRISLRLYFAYVPPVFQIGSICKCSIKQHKNVHETINLILHVFDKYN